MTTQIMESFVTNYIPKKGTVAAAWARSPLEIADIVEEYTLPVDVNAYDDNGKTPLLRALSKQRGIGIIKELLVHQANPFLRDKGYLDQSPLQYATQRAGSILEEIYEQGHEFLGGNAEVMSTIIDAQNKINPAESKKYIQEAIETAQSILEQFHQPNFDPDADKIIPGIQENLELLQSNLNFLESK
jgi:hypothetical protein